MKKRPFVFKKISVLVLLLGMLIDPACVGAAEGYDAKRERSTQVFESGAGSDFEKSVQDVKEVGQSIKNRAQNSVGAKRENALVRWRKMPKNMRKSSSDQKSKARKSWERTKKNVIQKWRKRPGDKRDA